MEGWWAMSPSTRNDSRPASRSRRRPGLLLVLLVAVACLLAVAITASMAIGSLRKGDLRSQTTSPDGRWTVRLYYHDSGAGGSNWVTAEASDSTGRVKPRQVAELNHPGRLQWTAGGDTVRTRWLSNAVLSISGQPVNVAHGYLTQ